MYECEHESHDPAESFPAVIEVIFEDDEGKARCYACEKHREWAENYFKEFYGTTTVNEL